MPDGTAISNISEWCKKDACWTRIQAEISAMEAELADDFWNELVSADEAAIEAKSARKTQKIDNGIDAQRKVISIPASEWRKIQQLLGTRAALSLMHHCSLSSVEMTIPNRILSEMLGQMARSQLSAIHAYDAFTLDNDPYGERDFGAVYQDCDGHWTTARPARPAQTVFWKIDAYDRNLRFGSEDATNPAITQRVLTIMLASEY